MKQGELKYLCTERNVGRSLERAERVVCRVGSGRMTPGQKVLMGDMGYLKSRAHDARRRFLFAYRLQKGEKDTRLMEMARDLAWNADGPVDEDRVLRAVKRENALSPFSLREMDMLPRALLMALMEKAAHESDRCREEGKVILHARRLLDGIRRGKKCRADDPVLLSEMLLAAREEGSVPPVLTEALNRHHLSPDGALDRLEKSRLELSVRLHRTIRSLKSVSYIDFFAVAQETLPLYRALAKNGAFLQLDDGTRRRYAVQCARLAGEWGVDEVLCARHLVREAAGQDLGFILFGEKEKLAKSLGVHMRFSPQKGVGDALVLLLSGAFFVLLTFLQVGDLWALLALPGVYWALRRVEKALVHLWQRPFLPRCREAQGQLLIALCACVQSEKQVLPLFGQLQMAAAAARQMQRDMALILLLDDGADEETRLRIQTVAEEAAQQLNTGKTAYACLLLPMCTDGGMEAACRLAQGTWDGALMGRMRDGRYSHVWWMRPGIFVPPGALQKLQGALCHPMQAGCAALLPFMAYEKREHPTWLERLMRAVGDAESSMPACALLDVERCLDRLSDKGADLRQTVMDGIKDAGVTCYFGGMENLFVRWQKRFDDLGGLCALRRKRAVLKGAGLMWAIGAVLISAWGKAPWLGLLLLPMTLRDAWKLLLLPGEGIMHVCALLKLKPRSGPMFLQEPLAVGAHVLLGAGVTWLAIKDGGCAPYALAGILWVLAPVWGYLLGVKRDVRLTGKWQALLRRMGADAWRFLDRHGVGAGENMPPQWVRMQEEEKAGPPCDIRTAGLYLLALLAAREMHLIDGKGFAHRLQKALSRLEHLPLYKGMPCDENGRVHSASVGVYALCLLAAARGAAVHLRKQGGDIPRRIGALTEQMELDALFDRRTGRFCASLQAGEQKGMLHVGMGEGRMLLFAALTLGKVPVCHIDRCNPPVTRLFGTAVLTSPGGTVSDYLLPHLLLPVYKDTLEEKSIRAMLYAQRMAARDGAWGMSEVYLERDGEVHLEPFGIPALTDRVQPAGHVTAPYALALMLPFMPRGALRALQSIMDSDAYGMGVFPDGMENAKAVSSVVGSGHQAILVCAAANMLHDGVLRRHLFLLPGARAHAGALMRPVKRYAPYRRDVRPVREKKGSMHMNRPAVTGGVTDGFLIGFQGRVMAVNSRGQGLIADAHGPIAPFSGAWDEDSGIRVYVRFDGGQEVRPALHACRMMTGEMRFVWEGERLKITERRTVSARDGAWLVHLRVDNMDRAPADVSVTCALPLVGMQEVRWEQPILCAHGKRHVCQIALGNGAAKAWLGDWQLFFGPGAAPHFPVTDAPVCFTGKSEHGCLSQRLHLTAGPGEYAECAFVMASGATRDEAARTVIQYHTPRQVLDAFRFTRFAALQRMRADKVDARQQTLFARLLGAGLFAMQPGLQKEKRMYEKAPADDVTADAPMLTLVLDTRADRALIRQLLQFEGWLLRNGLSRPVVIACPLCAGAEGIYGEAMRLVKLSGAKNVHLLQYRAHELPLLCARSAVVLKGGEGLEAQLDRWAQEGAFCDIPPKAVAMPAREAGGFGEEGTYRASFAPMTPWRHVLCGQNAGLWLTAGGIVSAMANGKQLTGYPGSICPPGESIRLQLKEGDVLLTLGQWTVDAGSARYESRGDQWRAVVEVFAHPQLPLTCRRVTVKGKIEGEIVWQVRFLMDGKQMRLHQSGDKVYALCGNDLRAGCGWAWGAEGRWESICAPCAEWRCPLSGDENTCVTLCIGMAEGLLRPLPAGDARIWLQDARRQSHQALDQMQLYTMEGRIDRWVNVWLPLQCQNAWRQGMGGMLSALGLLHRESSCMARWLSGQKDGPEKRLMAYIFNQTAGEEGEMPIVDGACISPEEKLWTAVLIREILADGKHDAGDLALRRQKRMLLEEVTAAYEGKDMPLPVCCMMVLSGLNLRRSGDMLREQTGRILDVRSGRLRPPAPGQEMKISHLVLLMMAWVRAEEGDIAKALLHALLETVEEGMMASPFRMPDAIREAGGTWQGVDTWSAEGAGAVLYAVTVFLLGFDRRGKCVTLRPAKNAWQEEWTYVLREGESTCRLTADLKALRVTLDGKKTEGDWLLLPDEPGICEGRFPIR